VQSVFEFKKHFC